MHIDAKGTIKDKSESINIGIDISNLNNAKIEITCWDEWNSITGKIEHKKRQQLVLQIMKWIINFKIKTKLIYWNVYGKQVRQRIHS